MNDTALEREFIQMMQRFGRLNIGALFDGVSKGEFFVLEMLCKDREKHPERTGMYVHRLVKQMFASPPAISRTLRIMEGKELIRRSVDSDDRRNTFIHITDQGIETRRGIIAKLSQFTNMIFTEMGEDNVRELIRLWGHLVELMEKELPSSSKGETKC